jgi:hypothetical protein
LFILVVLAKGPVSLLIIPMSTSTALMGTTIGKSKELCFEPREMYIIVNYSGAQIEYLQDP